MANGLYSIYGQQRQNPYEKKAALTRSMIPQSGFAAPALAMAMGKTMVDAEGWDEQRDQEMRAGLSQLRGDQQQKEAIDTLGKIFSIAKEDPQAATQAIQIEAQRNPHLAPYKSLQFNTKFQGDKSIVSFNGNKYQIKDSKAMSQLTSEDYAAGVGNEKFDAAFSLMGKEKEKEAKAPEVKTFPVGGRDVPHQYNPETKKWEPVPETGGPRWKPGEGDAAGEAAKQQAKTEQSKAVRVVVAEKFAAEIPDDLKASISDTSGAVDPTRVRSALAQAERDGKIPKGYVAGYDRAIIDAEDGVGKGKKSIARSVDDAIRKIHGENPNPGGGSQSPPVEKLKEGMDTTFGNGQVWTLKQGKPVRVR